MFVSSSLPMRRVALFLLTAFAVLSSFGSAWAKEQTYMSAPLVGGFSPIQGSATTNAYDVINANNRSAIKSYISAKSYVIFEFNKEDIRATAGFADDRLFNLKIMFEVKLWYDGENLNAPCPRAAVSDNLTLNYDPKSTNVSDLRSVKSYPNAVKIVVTVLNPPAPIPFIAAQRMPTYQLSCEVQVNRLFDFNPKIPLSKTAAFLDTKLNRINFSWCPKVGDADCSKGTDVNADEYDIEWNFYEPQSELGKAAYPYRTSNILPQWITDLISPTFRFNASRMTVSSDTAWIPSLYRAGFIFFRVRYARYLADGSRQLSEWSVPNYCTIETGHEADLNWQSDFTFAEDGKKAAAIKYFDKTLRERQAVSYSVANQTTYATQTVYDLAGRAAVKTMPLPTQIQTIQYNTGLAVSSISNQPYDVRDFDKADNCGIIVNPMSATSSDGAKYYSINNTKLNTSPSAPASSLKTRLVPNAGGFHFTVTQFTPDQTGRIKKQSGVGTTFRMNGGKETQYYYGKPSQEELDRLFGTEVGYASHYQKNMVRDPNGQVAVSYVDAHGRTIANICAGTHGAILGI